MGVLDDLADELARDALDAGDRMGQNEYYREVAKVLSESSATLEETFLTSIRIRLAERRGRAFLTESLSDFAKGARKA
ncbi:hypothetical protein AB9F29_02450 [Falsihalocynthiibacter sp. S25ZX9]|jgi:hypothetical protein|uniref:Uncharacterized protein n=1 Tax=Falsihalocynthiibacter arcticus TaxID=1579316 RepID=A0A126V4W2_9RHOB|nr:hypothetical protein [Falsihalocynthiibacter arcticus]AML52916.1 hypothetical protein RC74_18110 [Falsihalocynthiibacter arcticus]